MASQSAGKGSSLGPWRWPLAGVAATAVGACFISQDDLWWFLPVAALGDVFLLWTAWRESVAAKRYRTDPAVLQARLGQALALLTRNQPDAALAALDDLLPDLDRVLGPGPSRHPQRAHHPPAASR